MSVKSFISVAALAAVTGLCASIASASITIPTVPIGNPGNAADPTTGYGTVAYTYSIGQTEVTNAQYAAFLNSVAASDPFELYNPSMGDPGIGLRGGIERVGTSGQYVYSTIQGRENHPVNWVSFWDACRFANWLHNGQGSGSTETGAYTLTPDGIANNTITRNAGWQWAVPSQDEWYKAAYHQPASAGGDSDNYWLYPTMGNTVPDSSQANFGNSLSDTMPVGSYAANYYRTFDMGGNVSEWNEDGFRGGSFSTFDNEMRADGVGLPAPTVELESFGFRVVAIPGPSSVALLAIGGLGALRRRRGVGR